MKLILIRIILSIISLYALRLVCGHLIKDYYWLPDSVWVASVMQDQSYYRSGANIFIVSSGWMDRISRWQWFGTGAGSGTAKAMSLGPLVILRFHHHMMNKARINHELIHYQQCLQSACLLQIRSLWEYRRYRIQWYDNMDAYLMKTTEQEAYLNQYDFSYLTWQNLAHSLKYIPDKVNIEFGTWYQVLNKSSL